MVRWRFVGDKKGGGKRVYVVDDHIVLGLDVEDSRARREEGKGYDEGDELHREDFSGEMDRRKSRQQYAKISP